MFQVQLATNAESPEEAMNWARDLAAILTEGGYDLVGIEVIDNQGNDYGGVA